MQRAISIFLRDDFQKVFDLFRKITGIHISFDGLEFGESPRQGLNEPDSKYCTLLQCKLGWKYRCDEQDARCYNEAKQKRTLMCYQCHAGLTEAIYPVIIDDQLVGLSMIGQFRSHTKMPAHIEKAWNDKFGNHELLQAYENLPYVSAERLESILELFSLFIEHIISKRLIDVRGDRVIERILAYLRENPDKPINLDKAARLTNKSPSTISHLFQKRLGKTFKQVCIETKLQEAERLFSLHPELSIKEVALRVGMEDPFYFSRVYKKHSGRPPSRRESGD